MNPDERPQGLRRRRTKEELKAAYEAGASQSDLNAEVNEHVEWLKQREKERLVIRERIRTGLASNGKDLRRNAPCPCGSGKKFKKCHLPVMKAARNQPPQTETPEETTDDGHSNSD